MSNEPEVTVRKTTATRWMYRVCLGRRRVQESGFTDEDQCRAEAERAAQWLKEFAHASVSK